MDERQYKSILTNPEIKLEYIYEGDLDYDTIRENPILKPISEINKSYCDLHIMATKAILEFEEEYKKLQELESINPRYSNTVLMSTINKIINLIKTIIHSQDLQNISMKNAILEMIDINSLKFKLIDNEKERLEKIKEGVRKEIEEEIHSRETKPKSSNIEDGNRSSVDNNSFGEDEDKTPDISNEEDVFEQLKKITESEEKEVIPENSYSTLLGREI